MKANSGNSGELNTVPLLTTAFLQVKLGSAAEQVLILNCWVHFEGWQQVSGYESHTSPPALEQRSSHSGWYPIHLSPLVLSHLRFWEERWRERVVCTRRRQAISISLDFILLYL